MRPARLWPGLLLFLFAAAAAGLSLGASPIPLRDVWGILVSPAGRLAHPDAAQVILDIRLPRVLAAGLAGAALSAAGVLLQALLRNPLADPYVLGVSAGASVGAAAVITAGLAGAVAGLALPLASLAGALVATLLVYGIARGRGATELLLAGVVVASSLGALVTVALYLAAPQGRMQSVLLWTMGGFGESDWRRLTMLGPLVLLALAGAWSLYRELNALSFGEDSARSVGVDPGPSRGLALFASAALTAGAVALGGVIGFVGIMVPHAARRLVGPEHRRLVPAAAVAGAGFLMAVDAAARMMKPPAEVPVGLLTGLLGGPFFLFLMLRGRTLG